MALKYFNVQKQTQSIVFIQTTDPLKILIVTDLRMRVYVVETWWENAQLCYHCDLERTKS